MYFRHQFLTPTNLQAEPDMLGIAESRTLMFEHKEHNSNIRSIRGTSHGQSWARRGTGAFVAFSIALVFFIMTDYRAMTNQQTKQPNPPVRREDYKVQKIMQDIERKMAKVSEPTKN